jgi:WD40 repeat protein
MSQLRYLRSRGVSHDRRFEKRNSSTAWNDRRRCWSAQLLTLEGHSGLVSSVHFSLHGSTLASISYKETIEWDLSTYSLIEFIDVEGYVSDLAFR